MQLEQQRTHLLSLSSRWVNPLSPKLRFESRTKEAFSLATTLAGGATHLTQAAVPPVQEVVHVSLDKSSEEAFNAPLADFLFEETAEPAAEDIAPDLSSEENFNLPLTDYLAQESAEPDTEQPEEDDDIEPIPVRIIWELPPVSSSTRILHWLISTILRTSPLTPCLYR